MDNYKVQPINPTENDSFCSTCLHSFVPLDFLLGLNFPEVYCNKNEDKPISGDIMTEPFNYYDGDQLSAQEDAWDLWSKTHKVDVAGICDTFQKVSP